MTTEKEEIAIQTLPDPPVSYEPLPARDWHAIDEDTQETLDKMILNTPINKYDLIILARRWAYELKNKEGENRSAHNLVPDSIKDILTEKVKLKTIKDLPPLRFLTKKIKGPAILDNIGKNFSEKESEPKGKSKKK